MRVPREVLRRPPRGYLSIESRLVPTTQAAERKRRQKRTFNHGAEVAAVGVLDFLPPSPLKGSTLCIPAPGRGDDGNPSHL